MLTYAGGGDGEEAAEEDEAGDDTKSNGYQVYQTEPLPFWGLAGDVQGGMHYVSS
jgi:hypothetical protein